MLISALICAVVNVIGIHLMLAWLPTVRHWVIKTGLPADLAFSVGAFFIYGGNTVMGTTTASFTAVLLTMSLWWFRRRIAA